jgi:hypothetical protein|tara:strand:+ start:1163 stop:1348 length:186 start_codon:yes stop_codon:yes gene_type:complete
LQPDPKESSAKIHILNAKRCGISNSAGQMQKLPYYSRQKYCASKFKLPVSDRSFKKNETPV